MTETIGLKVDRHLIDPNFETYYLSNHEIDCQSIDLPNSLNEFTLTDKQLYSYLHFSAFSKELNYLFTDPYNGQHPVCYYVDNQLDVLRAEIDYLPHSINLPVRVFNLPNKTFKPSECMVTLSFPSKDLALIVVSQCANINQMSGHLSLLIVHTGDRQIHSNSNWTVVKSFDLSDTSSSFDSCWQNGEQNAKHLNTLAKIIDSNFQSNDIGDLLKVIICNVTKNNDEKFECMLNCLHLCKLKQEPTDKQEWTIDRLQQLTGSTYPYYIGVDINNEDLYLTFVSTNRFQLTYDSLGEPDYRDNYSAIKDTDQEKENSYFYYQDGSEITVDFKLPLDIAKSQIEVNFGADNIEIKARGERVFKETLWATIETEACTWTLEKILKDVNNSVLELTLIKKDESQQWNQLIKGKEYGTQLMTPEESASLKELNSLIASIAHSNQPTDGYIPSISGNEQCDEVSEDLIFYRFNCNTNSITHQACLGGHQWLFSCKADSDLLPFFSLRHDVDAIIWQPKVNGSAFCVEHIATFSALGYVQASKESKKFFNCSPDFDYAFISDSTNHIFIYKQPARCDQLVNRKKGIRPKIAKQKVVNLGHELVQVLGSVAFKDSLLVASPRKLISIKTDF